MVVSHRCPSWVCELQFPVSSQIDSHQVCVFRLICYHRHPIHSPSHHQVPTGADSGWRLPGIKHAQSMHSKITPLWSILFVLQGATGYSNIHPSPGSDYKVPITSCSGTSACDEMTLRSFVCHSILFFTLDHKVCNTVIG